MILYSNSDMYKLYGGSMLDILESIDPCSIDSIVTDPPYELNFMNKSWDNSGIAFQKDTWEKCFSVLKPGGYLLAFGAPRTFHRLACAIEDAGFEIRDTIMWMFGNGFPKSMNIGIALDKKLGVESEFGGIKPGHKDFVGRETTGHMNYAEIGTGEFDRPWMHDPEKQEAYHYEKIPSSEIGKRFSGFGTALKPAYEPIIVARKPLEGTCVDNVIKYGVGGINIDECRVPTDEIIQNHSRSSESSVSKGIYGDSSAQETHQTDGQKLGRFPANVILTYDDSDFDEVCGGFPDTKTGKAVRHNSGGCTFGGDKKKPPMEDLGYDDGGGSAARYFYCAKASKRDRDEGLDAFDTKQTVGGGGGIGDYLKDVNSASGKYGSEKAPHKNFHPTVKPTSLMQYLVRLVTPNGGTVLDPFMGSGSTGKAVAYENNDRGSNYSFIGIEINEDYMKIAEARINYALSDKTKIDAKPNEPKKDPESDNRRRLF